MRPSALLISFLLSFIPFTICTSAERQWKSFETIPAKAATGPTNSKLISDKFGLDASKLDRINDTSYEWWYFDVVSEDQKYNVVIVFFAAPEDGFPLSQAPAEDITVAFISISTPDDEDRFAEYVNATKADILTVGNGASGTWHDSGFSFTGSADLSHYTVSIDSTEIGVSGQITFKSVSPAHYVCSPAVSGQNMEVLPHIGWTNAIPDSQAHVDLTVNGKEICFSGAGYHDMNWGDAPFTENIQGWIWGHGRLGPYSLVWFDGFDRKGDQRTGFYIAKGGKIIANQCSGISVTPVAKHGRHRHDFFLEADLGQEGLFTANLTVTVRTVNQEVFSRFTGLLKGGFSGQQAYEGPALYEVFDLSSPELVRQT